MLLHVIEAAGPVQLSPDSPAGQRRYQQVGYSLALIHHLGHFHPIEPAGIAGLTTGGGIKGSTIEVNAPPGIASVDDGRLELAQVRVDVIEALRHGNPAPGKEVCRILER
jgi:hypothetical protein